VNAKTATYAIATSTMLGRGLEVAKGALTGSAAQVNKLREISEKEIEQCEHFPLSRVAHIRLPDAH